MGVNLCWGNDVFQYKGKYYCKADAGSGLGTAVKAVTNPQGGAGGDSKGVNNLTWRRRGRI